jgi:hypothetical protein
LIIFQAIIYIFIKSKKLDFTPFSGHPIFDKISLNGVEISQKQGNLRIKKNWRTAMTVLHTKMLQEGGFVGGGVVQKLNYCILSF